VVTRRSFTQEYKDQAVSLHLDSGRSINYPVPANGGAGEGRCLLFIKASIATPSRVGDLRQFG
jgi:hypothetical protein